MNYALPLHLHTRILDIFSRCDLFNSNDQLKAIFTTIDLAPFRANIPDTGNSKADRVRGFIYFGVNTITHNKPILLCCIEALCIHVPTANDLHRELTNLKDDLIKDVYRANIFTEIKKLFDAAKVTSLQRHYNKSKSRRIIEAQTEDHLDILKILDNLYEDCVNYQQGFLPPLIMFLERVAEENNMMCQQLQTINERIALELLNISASQFAQEIQAFRDSLNHIVLSNTEKEDYLIIDLMRVPNTTMLTLSAYFHAKNAVYPYVIDNSKTISPSDLSIEILQLLRATLQHYAPENLVVEIILPLKLMLENIIKPAAITYYDEYLDEHISVSKQYQIRFRTWERLEKPPLSPFSNNAKFSQNWQKFCENQDLPIEDLIDWSDVNMKADKLIMGLANIPVKLPDLAKPLSEGIPILFWSTAGLSTEKQNVTDLFNGAVAKNFSVKLFEARQNSNNDDDLCHKLIAICDVPHRVPLKYFKDVKPMIQPIGSV